MHWLMILLMILLWVILFFAVIFISLYAQNQETKKRLSKIRINIKETVERLKTRDVTGDTYAVDDAIDFLCGINDSYADEIPFLIEELEKAEEEETLNFIICVLKIMNNTLNTKIISILESKIYLLSNKILQGKSIYNTYDTIVYVFDYFISQGNANKEAISSLLSKLISSEIHYSIKRGAKKTLKKINSL